MELLILIAANVILTCIVFYQIISMKKLSETYIDALLQKNVGIYYPKDRKEPQKYEEQDTNDSVPLEDLSDEDFLKAAKGNLNG